MHLNYKLFTANIWIINSYRGVRQERMNFRGLVPTSRATWVLLLYKASLVARNFLNCEHSFMSSRSIQMPHGRCDCLRIWNRMRLQKKVSGCSSKEFPVLVPLLWKIAKLNKMITPCPRPSHPLWFMLSLSLWLVDKAQTCGHQPRSFMVWTGARPSCLRQPAAEQKSVQEGCKSHPLPQCKFTQNTCPAGEQQCHISLCKGDHCYSGL